jgi:mercuric reductase
MPDERLAHERQGTELKELPSSPLIVGGGYIALELGQMFRRLGSAAKEAALRA